MKVAKILLHDFWVRNDCQHCLFCIPQGYDYDEYCAFGYRLRDCELTVVEEDDDEDD